MNSAVNAILLILNVIFFAVIALLVPFSIYEQIMGPADAKKLLKKLHIPLSYNQVLIIWFVCIAMSAIIWFLRAKLSGRL